MCSDEATGADAWRRIAGVDVDRRKIEEFLLNAAHPKGGRCVLREGFAKCDRCLLARQGCWAPEGGKKPFRGGLLPLQGPVESGETIPQHPPGGPRVGRAVTRYHGKSCVTRPAEGR